MELEKRIRSFALLGETLRNELNGSSWHKLIENQQIHNPWFTPDNVRRAVGAIAEELTETNLITWTNTYPGLSETLKPVKVGVIMAGNIPLAGFHDFISVLITGNDLIVKTSSKDFELITYIAQIICRIEPGFSSKIEFTEGTLRKFDLVIATGSDNSSRYFDYYFGKYPNIIRKNRNSIAILEGDESEDEIRELGSDIFSYFGLGCRNVSKIYVPEGFDLLSITRYWDNFGPVINHPKYANNYDFNKAVFIVNKEAFIDTGYLLLKEDSGISSPVSVLNYEYYSSREVVKEQTNLLNSKIQCIVGRHYIPFGKAQSPHLWDYADGIDTIEFLLKKNLAGIL